MNNQGKPTLKKPTKLSKHIVTPQYNGFLQGYLYILKAISKYNSYAISS